MIAFIDEQRGAYGVEPICRVLPIAPSTYHAHVAKRDDPTRLSARAKRDDGLMPEKRERVFTALVRQVEALAQHRPVLLLFEDAHWSDSTSLELLDRIAERVRRLPVLMFVTFRPEFEPLWTGQAGVTSVTLSRLGQRETKALVGRVAGGRVLPVEILDRIIEHTDGIPLCIEELTRTLLEGNLLQGEDGKYILSGPLPTLAIPSSLHDSLMARLDRLESVKEIAQLGASIGREFSYATRLAPGPSCRHRQGA